MKVIPAIDLMDGQVVRLYKGDPNQKTIYSDSPVDTAKQWESDGADMLHLVDLDATLGRGSNLDTIKEIISSVSVPIQVAGGLRDESIVMEVSELSPRLVLGTMAFKDKPLLKLLLSELGPQKIVISVDHMAGNIVINGWQKNTGIPLIPAVKEFLDMGFTEFLLTDVSRDGTLVGPDLNFLAQACVLPKSNVIASGGISNSNDVKNVKEQNAFGVILGKALYENKVSIGDAKKLS